MSLNKVDPVEEQSWFDNEVSKITRWWQSPRQKHIQRYSIFANLRVVLLNLTSILHGPDHTHQLKSPHSAHPCPSATPRLEFIANVFHLDKLHSFFGQEIFYNPTYSVSIQVDDRILGVKYRSNILRA